MTSYFVNRILLDPMLALTVIGASVSHLGALTLDLFASSIFRVLGMLVYTTISGLCVGDGQGSVQSRQHSLQLSYIPGPPLHILTS